MNKGLLTEVHLKYVVERPPGSCFGQKVNVSGSKLN
uniref:Uncharacterized protein n=1 Tax=Arundo donax TaxID=35708 RepID=A0A0A9FID7_ARUDO